LGRAWQSIPATKEERHMRPVFVGVDVAIAKEKRLPIVICTLEQGRLIPKRLRRLDFWPPRGRGNAAILDGESVRSFACEAREYIAEVCDYLELEPACIGIDAPAAPCGPRIPRRAVEVALDRAGISCFATPTTSQFDLIRAKVARHLAAGGSEDRIPHANQLWMIVGFAVFEELSRLAPCLEVFPQATARAIGAGDIHKSRRGAVGAQLRAAAMYTG
jgi:Protein of unknown function (DUF429)